MYYNGFIFAMMHGCLKHKEVVSFVQKSQLLKIYWFFGVGIVE